MKALKLFFLAAVLSLGLSACDGNENLPSKISDNQVYFFYQTTCPHCHHAADYVKKKYPDLNIVAVNIAQHDGFKLFEKCARKFDLTENLGTPLFCMGDKYLMGWSSSYEKQFDAYVQPFLNKQAR